MEPPGLLVDAISLAAQALDRRERVRESDFEEAVMAALAPARAGVRSRQRISLESWPGVGNCDIGIANPSYPILVELKWGGDSLWNCAWDVAKLATALAEKKAAEAYIAAGASAVDWDARRRGAELFDSRDWTLQDLLDRYRFDFAFWREQVNTHPIRLPAQWQVEAVDLNPLHVGGLDYDIRLARIHVSEPALLAVKYTPEIARRRVRSS